MKIALVFLVVAVMGAVMVAADHHLRDNIREKRIEHEEREVAEHQLKENQLRRHTRQIGALEAEAALEDEEALEADSLYGYPYPYPYPYPRYPYGRLGLDAYEAGLY